MGLTDNKNIHISYPPVITFRYLGMTTDVLASVKKMEESLKRLKRAKAGGGTAASDSKGGLSDDDKIRLQFYLDVTELGKQVRMNWVSIKI